MDMFKSNKNVGWPSSPPILLVRYVGIPKVGSIYLDHGSPGGLAILVTSGGTSADYFCLKTRKEYALDHYPFYTNYVASYQLYIAW